MKLGAVGTIPLKVPKGQEPSNHKSSEPASSKKQASGTATDDRRIERIFLSKESMARVRDAVEHGKLLPENATRDELRAYNKLARELTKQTRQQCLGLKKQEKVAIEQKNNRKPPPRSDSPDHDSPTHVKSKLSNLRRKDRERVVR